MKKTYKKEFMPYGLQFGYCSLTVLAGLINYFFGTNLSSKDNFDLLGIVNRSRWNRSDLLSLNQIALFLDRLYLDVTIYTSMNSGDKDILLNGSSIEKTSVIKKNMKKEFHHNIVEGKRRFEDGSSIDIIDNLLDTRIQKSDISRKCSINADEAIDIIGKQQGNGTLFILGCNKSILYTGVSENNDGEGHIVVCSGITRDKLCIIHEPNQPRPNPNYIHIQQVKKAISELGGIEMIKVKDNPSHI